MELMDELLEKTAKIITELYLGGNWDSYTAIEKKIYKEKAAAVLTYCSFDETTIETEEPAIEVIGTIVKEVSVTIGGNELAMQDPNEVIDLIRSLLKAASSVWPDDINKLRPQDITKDPLENTSKTKN